MPGWPTGADTKRWMRTQSVGADTVDGAVLDEVTLAAREEIEPMLDAELLDSTITTAALTANVATITTAAPHSFAVGDAVAVSGVTEVFDGDHEVTAVTARTVSYAKVNPDVVSAAASGSIEFVDGCPSSVVLATKIRAAALFVRRGSPNGVIQVTPELAIRVSQYDADVEKLIRRWSAGADPVFA